MVGVHYEVEIKRNKEQKWVRPTNAAGPQLAGGVLIAAGDEH